MKRIIFLLLISLSMAGCAQKFPTSVDNNQGLIVIPVKAKSDMGPYFFYYYKLHSDEPNPAVITIHPAQGVDFAFSDPLPAGDYWFSSMDIIANPSPSTITSVAKSTQHISFPVKVEPGKANMLSRIMEITVKEVEHRRYSSRGYFRDMDDEEEQHYIEKLKALDEKNEWEVF